MNIYNYKQIKRHCLLTVILIFSIHQSSCQRSLSPQAQKAVDLFNSGLYVQAQVEFQNLTVKYPKDNLYQMYLGATYSETNPDQLKAIDILQNVQQKSNLPVVYYYLGKAYYKAYRFDDAQKYFETYKDLADKREGRQKKVDDEIRKCKDSKVFITSSSKYITIWKQKTSADSLYINFDSILKSDVYEVTEKNKKNEIRCVNCKKNESYQELYYSNGTKEKDIFKVNFKSMPQGEIESLGNIINTSEDDNYPFYDSGASTLYFASKGHGSIGGYDIFKSKYDVKNKKWGTPEQLPFPINSPFDDYLPVITQGRLFFVSNREAQPFSVVGYCITLIDSVASLESAENMYSVSLMKLKKEKSVKKKSIEKKKPTEEGVKTVAKPVAKSDNVAEIVTLALELQAKSDSCYYKSRLIKQKISASTDKALKAKLFSEASKFDKRALSYQTEADVYYNQLSQLNQFNDFLLADSVKAEEQFVFDDNTYYSKENPVPVFNLSIDGLIYMIQLGAFSKTLDYQKISGISPVSAENFPESKIIKYYTGIFLRFERAENALALIKSRGFKEAFIIAYYNRKKIPLEKARELENDF